MTYGQSVSAHIARQNGSKASQRTKESSGWQTPNTSKLREADSEVAELDENPAIAGGV